MAKQPVSSAGMDNEKGYLLPWIFIFGIGIVILHRSFIFESFWLDECITAWVIRGSSENVVSESLKYQGQSPLYYLLLWGWSHVWGSSEAALRAFSMLCIVGAGFFWYKLVRSYCTPAISRLAILFAMVLSPVVIAFSARPYAFALLSGLCASYLFTTLLSQPKNWILIIAYSCILSFTFYAHYLFSLIALVHAYLLFASHSWKPSSKSIKATIYAWVISAIICLPGLSQLISLYLRRSKIAFLPAPSLSDLSGYFFPAGPLLAAAIGIAVSFVVVKGATFKFVNCGPIKIFLVWFSAIPLALAILSYLGAPALFLARYMLWALLGISAVLAIIVQCIEPRFASKVAVIAIFAMLFTGESSRRYEVEDWRSAANIISTVPDAPVLFNSGLIESADSVTLNDLSWRDYLSVPFKVYSVKNQIQLLSAKLQEDELSAELERGLAVNKSVWIVGPKKIGKLAADLGKENKFEANIALQGQVWVVQLSKRL